MGKAKKKEIKTSELTTDQIEDETPNQDPNPLLDTIIERIEKIIKETVNKMEYPGERNIFLLISIL